MIIKNKKNFSFDEKVILKIYEFIEIKKEPIYYLKLIESLKGEINKNVIDKSESKLIDLGMIKLDWNNVNGKWVRTYEISRCYLNYFKSLYETSQKVGEKT